ncbi:MAG: undecaprenyl-diphosphate phosphatase [Firmicutes bacterium]|nr:undecaprenyl-diphosphate phosphatase [Bacillota bacterium]
MTNLNALMLGLIQGLTEFIPISSSGHLVIFQHLFGLDDCKQYIVFDIVLHIGTLVSVLFFYWKDVLGLIKSFFGFLTDLVKGKKVNFKDDGLRVLVSVIIGTIPLVVAVLIKSKVENLFSSLLFVGCALLVTGGILFLTDKINKMEYTIENMPYKNAFIVGLFQLFAILPGISRSGSTIFGGVATGLKRESAVKFSLLLSILAILGAAAASIPELFSETAPSATLFQYISGAVVAAVSGIFAIKFLVKMLSKGKFKFFAIYSWVVGVVIILISIGVR